MPKHAAPEGQPFRGRARGRLTRRDRRGAREWVVACYLPLAAPLQFAFAVHAPWYEFPLYCAAAALFVVAAMSGSAYGARLAARMRKPRSRVVYLSLACCWLAVAVPCGIAGARLPQAGWAANALGEAMAASAFAALVMLGRAAAWGHARRYFWLRPPGGAAPAGPASPAG